MCTCTELPRPLAPPADHPGEPTIRPELHDLFPIEARRHERPCFGLLDPNYGCRQNTGFVRVGDAYDVFEFDPAVAGSAWAGSFGAGAPPQRIPRQPQKEVRSEKAGAVMPLESSERVLAPSLPSDLVSLISPRSDLMVALRSPRAARARTRCARPASSEPAPPERFAPGVPLLMASMRTMAPMSESSFFSPHLLAFSRDLGAARAVPIELIKRHFSARNRAIWPRKRSRPPSAAHGAVTVFHPMPLQQHEQQGGASPLCYPKDVSDAAVEAYRRRSGEGGGSSGATTSWTLDGTRR